MRDPIDVIDEALLIASNQFRESITIALEDPRNQGAVIELLTFGHRLLRLPQAKVFSQRIIHTLP
jgi:hypothetical protein